MTLQYTAMVSWTIQGKRNLLPREKTIRNISANSMVEAGKKALASVKNKDAVINCLWPDYPQQGVTK